DPNWNNRKACVYQLGFVLLLGRIYNVEKVYIYDPKIGEVDQAVCGRFNIEVLSPCEEERPVDEGAHSEEAPRVEAPSGEAHSEEAHSEEAHIVEPHKVVPPSGETPRDAPPKEEKDDETSHTIAKTGAHERTLVFMPHCDVSLYSQVMHNIYINEKLSYAKLHFLLTLEKTIFMGNSFAYYREHTYMYRPFGIPAYAIRLLRRSGGTTLLENATESSLNRLEQFYKKDHFLFYVHKYAKEEKFPIFDEHVSAFNDMAIITFGSMPDRFSFWLDIWKEVTSGGPN
ncbi:hypothetical protein PCYB_041740, partial [Plasmodium cynomolgi strain B]